MSHPASPNWSWNGSMMRLAEGEPMGTMSAVVFSPRMGRTIGLAQILRRIADSHRPLEVEAPIGRFEAFTHPLPYLDRSEKVT